MRVKYCELVPHWNGLVGMEVGGACGEAINDQTGDIVWCCHAENRSRRISTYCNWKKWGNVVPNKWMSTFGMLGYDYQIMGVCNTRAVRKEAIHRLHPNHTP